MVCTITATSFLSILVTSLVASSWATLFKGIWQRGASTGTTVTLSLLTISPTSPDDTQSSVAIALFGFDVSERGRSLKEQLSLLNTPKVVHVVEVMGNITESPTNSSDRLEKQSSNSSVYLRLEDSVSPFELFQRKSEIAIGFLKTTTLSDSADRVDFLAFVKAFADGLLSKKITSTSIKPKLFLIIDGNDMDVAALTAEVQTVIKSGLDAKLLEVCIYICMYVCMNVCICIT